MKILNTLILVAISICLQDCTNQLYVTKTDTIIIKGESLKLGSFSISDINTMNLGTPTEISHGNFSTENIFEKKGISFTFRKNDKEKVIEWVSINPSRTACNFIDLLIIKRGVILDDIVDVFGESQYSSVDNDMVNIDYGFFDLDVNIDTSLYSQDYQDNLEWDELYKIYSDAKIQWIHLYEE